MDLDLAAGFTYRLLSNITTEQFQRGGDKAAREMLARAMADAGLGTLDCDGVFVPNKAFAERLDRQHRMTLRCAAR